MTVTFAGETHPGRVRSDNEDVIGWKPEHGLYLVADGMGGHASGEIASAIVRDVLLARSDDGDLEASICGAHRAVADAAQGDEARSGMGSTVVVLRINGRSARVAWVGDSRAYLWRRNTLSRLTRDHSFVELLRDRDDDLSETQLRNHPNRNVVTQTLGLGDPKPSAVEVSLRQDDRIVLCSDGLNDELTDEEIAEVMRSQDAVTDAARSLVEQALAHGGRDNVSVIVVAYRNDAGSGLADIWRRLRDWLKAGK